MVIKNDIRLESHNVCIYACNMSLRDIKRQKYMLNLKKTFSNYKKIGNAVFHIFFPTKRRKESTASPKGVIINIVYDS